MKTLKQTLRTAALAALLALGATAMSASAATLLLDLNGTNAGFGGPSGSADLTTTQTWTLDPNGTNAPVLFSTAAGDNLQIGGTNTDFNGGAITVNMSDAASIGASPAAFTVISSNVIVTMSGTANCRFNHAFSFNVAAGSTLILTTTANNNGWNFNSEACTLLGGGTMNFRDAFAANDNATAGITQDMTNGTVLLNQANTSNFGQGTSPGLFTLKTGTLIFGSATALADTFVHFTTAGGKIVIGTNSPTIDNASGTGGILALGAGAYTIAGDFTFIGSSTLGLSNANAVTLTGNSQITVNSNALLIGGAITDGGLGLGITKAGAGTLQMTNANNYTGATAVNGGTLNVSTASTGGGSYSVADGATLDVSAPGPGQQLTVSSLTLGSGTGATLAIDPGLLNNPTVAPIKVTGALTINGAAGQISFPELAAITNYPIAIPLVSYGSISGDPTTFTLGSFPLGAPAFTGFVSNDTVGQVVYLVLTNGLLTAPPGPAKNLVWSGTENNSWDTSTFNWLFNGVLTNYANLTTNGSGDNVQFDDTAVPTETNINLKIAFSPSSIVVTNDTLSYTFAGNGRITGAVTPVLKEGTNILIIDNSGLNDFGGGLSITNGTLQIGENDANGGIGSGSVTNDGVLILDRSDTAFTYGGVIAGAGELAVNGTGTVTLTGTETYTGPTVVNAGTLNLNGPNTANSTISTSSLLTINSGAIVQIVSDNSLGNGPALPVTINGGGKLTGLSTSDGGAGTSSHLHGTLTLNGGALAMGGTSVNLANGSWDLQGTPDAVVTTGGSTTSTITAFDVIPEEAGGTSFNIAAGTASSGIDLDVTGSLINGTGQHDTGIIKNGTGTLRLSSTNTIIGGVTINAGTLIVNSAENAGVSGPLGAAGTITFGGGILQYSAANNFDYSPRFNGGGTFIINTAGQNVTYSAPLASGTMTKLGTGSLTLNGANSFGDTLVSAGSLVMNTASTGDGNFTVTNSSTLDVQVASAGSQLNMSSLTVGRTGTDTDTLVIDTRATGSPSVAPIAIGGAFTVLGTLNVQLSGSAISTGTSIPLISYSSESVAGATIHLVTSPRIVATLSDNGAGLISVNITSADPTIEWLGGATGVWDTNNPANLVWQGINSHTATDFTENPTGNDAVLFDDNATGVTTVNVSTNVIPSVLTISNSAKTYTFSGTGKITGSATLTKEGSGKVTLTETGGDAFTGGIAVFGGTLVMSNTAVNINGGILVTNGSLVIADTGTNSGGVVVTNTGAVNITNTGTISGGLTSSASLTVTGSPVITGGVTVNGGLTVLDQNSTISGVLNINSDGTPQGTGIVRVGNSDASGSLPSGVTTNNGVLLFDRADTALNVSTVIAGAGTWTNIGTGNVTLSATETFTGTVVVDAGTLTLSAGNNAAPNGLSRATSLTINTNSTVAVLIDNSLAGHGAVAVVTLPIFLNAGGVLTGAPGADGGAGVSTHIPGTITFGGGLLTNSGTSINNANGSWDLDGGVATSGSNITSIIGCLSVAPTQVGGTTFDVIAGDTLSGIDLDVTGTLIHATSQTDSGINMTGNGVLRLSNTNTYTGGTVLSAGTVIVNAPENPGTNGPLGASGLITFAGGTLEYSPNNSFDYSSRFSGSSPYIINTAGQSVTFATALAGGGLAKLGGGTLTTTGANTYNGDTDVAGGELITTTASTGAGNYVVTNDTTLDIQQVSPGGQLAVNNLTLGADGADVTTLEIDTLTNGSPATAPVTVTGALALNGTVNIGIAGSKLTTGTFPLISYAGGESGAGTLHFSSPSAVGTLIDNHTGLISVNITSTIVPTPRITAVSFHGTTLNITATNGLAGGPVILLTSTNIATPVSQWTPVLTNNFDANGDLSISTNIVNTAASNAFYILKQ